MKRCRKEHGAHMLAQCTNTDCKSQQYIPHSCGHRNCPHCQSHENQQWISNQLSKRLPADYYLITFTLPKQLRKLCWQHQKIIYTIMFKCVQDLLKMFCSNDKKLQGVAGFTAVLHTHSRQLDFHPHIHVVMVGGSINKGTGLWRVKSVKYLFSHKAMAKVFRAKLLEALVDHGLQVPKKCPKKWVVDCKRVGNGEKAIIYLGNYLYKGVIKERDILKCEQGMITFRYFHSMKKRYQTKKVSGEYFLMLLMFHVLPNRFRKVRCYGFLHPCSKKMIKLLQLVLQMKPSSLMKKLKPRPTLKCPCCGTKMKIIRVMIPASRINQHSLAAV